MKLELSSGCVAYGLDVDGKPWNDISDVKKEYIINKIFKIPIPKDSYYNILENFIETLGEYECDNEPCGQCGDYVSIHTLNI